jgi:hypothetical protein
MGPRPLGVLVSTEHGWVELGRARGGDDTFCSSKTGKGGGCGLLPAMLMEKAGGPEEIKAAGSDDRPNIGWASDPCSLEVGLQSPPDDMGAG